MHKRTPQKDLGVLCAPFDVAQDMLCARHLFPDSDLSPAKPLSSQRDGLTPVIPSKMRGI